MVRKYGRTISIVEIAFCLSWQHSAPFSPFFFSWPCNSRKWNFIVHYKVHICWEGHKFLQNFVAFSEYTNFIMHNKISLPGIAWSRKKKLWKGSTVFSREAESYFYNRNCAAVFPDHRFRSPYPCGCWFLFRFLSRLIH